VKEPAICYTSHRIKDLREQDAMTKNLHAFMQDTTQSLIPLHTAYSSAMWEAATTGDARANEREKEAQVDLMRFWSNEARFLTANEFLASADIGDAITAREIKRIYLSAAKAQQDEESIQKITELEALIRNHYYNYRAEIDHKRVTDNELEHVLRTSSNSDEVRDAWEASKQIGALVADEVRELARMRNRAARNQGYRDHFQRSLILNEIDEEELFAIFDDLDAATMDPFMEYKADLDLALANRFGIKPDELRPWHFGDRFFQEVPLIDDYNPDTLFEGKDLVDLAIQTYTGLGLDVEDIVQRSDLYPREGKNQHAFCIDLDREGDVRTLNNLEPSLKWMNTLLHELGHAVYDKYIDRSLPWILRTPPHTLSTEAIALLMGSVTRQETWLTGVLGLSPADASALSAYLSNHSREGRLVFTRWVLVMTNFERAMYGDPEADLDKIWWDLVEKHQLLQKPEGREAPDWAAKYHIPLVPVYYQNYELGSLLASQLEHSILKEVGGFIGNPSAGRWLIERVFLPGNREDWSSHVTSVTGEPLDPSYFVNSISK
jgi:peptidyl-dipeptidase A